MSTIIEESAASLGYARLKRNKRRLCTCSPLPLVTTCLCLSPQDWQVVVLRFAAIYLRCEAGIGGEEVSSYGSVATDSTYIARKNLDTQDDCKQLTLARLRHDVP